MIFVIPALVRNLRAFALLNRNDCTCSINKYTAANYCIG